MAKIFFTDSYVLPLPEGHRFPMSKYALLRARVIDSQIVPFADMWIPHAATDEEILRVHTPDYLTRVVKGELSAKELRKIGFPWSPAMVERSRRSSGATIEACRAALAEGVGINLAGGTHHAFADSGGGYCVFNDSAIAARAMQAEHRAKRIVILDCDVHQGDGTAAIFQDDPTVFTFSIHGATNYPFHKQISDLDIPLPDGADDAFFLEALENGVRRALSLAGAELAIYLAGADPFAEDRFGKMKVSKHGLRLRDQIVFSLCKEARLPVAVSMAGGYAKNILDAVDIHFETVRQAVVFFPSPSGQEGYSG
ncbi:MAG TPA: histone deacetylase [Aggregatilineales bacterium]|nr:histone deacetylase [Anaerolineales bacterium]HRE48758.1 histone deacetylase [Aggregatilineales bacterium]